MRVLPDSVTVDGVCYEVRYMTPDAMLVEVRTEDVVGYVSQTRNIIFILDTLAPSAQEAALIHEVCHIINGQHHLSLTEQEVSTLGVCIPAFLKANGFWHNSHRGGEVGPCTTTR